MQRPRRTLQAAATAALIAAWSLAGCEFGVLTRPEEPRAAAPAPLSQSRLRATAESLERDARAADPQARDALLDRAAEAWFAAGDTRRAQRTLETRAVLPGPEGSAVLQVLAARSELERGAPARTLQRVAGLERPLPANLAAEAQELEGRARFALGDGGGAVVALVARSKILTDRAERRANERLIWESLQRPGLSLRAPAGADAETRGWLELASIAAGRDMDTPDPALRAWRERYPGHPADATLVEPWLAETRRPTRFPRRVALLLPLSGQLEPAAAAARDGFLSAHFAQAASETGRPEIAIYDSRALGPEAAYTAAVNDGADLVVGPLGKTEVSRVAAAHTGVPVLALNNLADGEHAPPGFYQFALAPEEEAEQTVARALADGYTEAIALVADDELGQRLFTSFRLALERGGGRLLGYEVFRPSANDHQGEIRRLLARLPPAPVDPPAGAAARPREAPAPATTFLFLAAQAPQARLLRPELRFHSTLAGDLPIYATSSVFEPPATANEDLDGVIFADMPWVLAAETDDPLHQALRELGSRSQRRARLYALGFDAYRLVPLLYARGSVPATLPGATGRLRVEVDGRIRRELAFAEFRGGVPRIIPTPLRSDVAGSLRP